MNVLHHHGLKPHHLAILQEALRPHAAKIDRVGLFGSRAQGTHKNASDIDLVIFGSIGDHEIGTIELDLEESYLPFTVDVLAYHLIDSERLRAHINLVFLPLFTGEELMQPVQKLD